MLLWTAIAPSAGDAVSGFHCFNQPFIAPVIGCLGISVFVHFSIVYLCSMTYGV
jgi:hypothetical protein